MDLRQLRYFTILADTLNFRRAAERLNMSQPPLTVAIRKLEEELGAPLFVRGPRGVALTPAGQAALSSARAALSQAEYVRQAVREGVAGERGQLTIGFVSSAIFALLPRLIPLYRHQFPQVELVLEESISIEIASRIRRRRMDIGFVRLPLLEGTDLETSVIEIDHFMAAVPLSSPLAQRKTIPLRLFATLPFITYPRTSVLYANILMACHEAGFTPHVAQETAQVHTLLSLVQSGLGIGLVPSKATRYVPEGVKLLRLNRPPRIEMGLAVARAGAGPLAHHFRRVAEAEFSADLLSTQK